MVFGAADALSPLTEEQALKFFASQDGTSVEDLSPVAAQVAETCGYLPLALAWVGAMVRLRRSGWDDIFARLERVDIVEVKRRFPDHPYPDLLRALEVSVEFLGSARRQRYFELSVFPKGMAIPDAPLLVLWSAAGLEPEEVWDRASDFVARSLAVRDVSGLRLHDFQVDYICERAGDLSLLHARIVDSYAVDCPYGFARGPNDGYFFQRLPYHLARAEREGDLRGLLFDFLWLYAKLEATDVSNLLADFELLPSDPDALKVQGAIRLAGHILSRDPKQFAGQLLGRLVAAGSPDLSRLLEGAKAWNEAPWLRPLVASLTPPDSGLLVILEGHTDSVEAVACLDARRVISASEDRTLRVWDVDTGRVLLVLEGHTDRVRAVLCLDARRAISASDDGTLRIWDAETGETLRTLEGHTNCVIAVARLDDRRVVSGSDDGTLRVWDLDTGQNLLVLGGGGSRVRAVACLDESRIVCSSGYETLHVWDIETGKIVRELMGHAHEVLALARIDERRIISASWDCTLRVWDLESGQTLRKLTERSMVLGVTRLDDRRVVSSSCGKTLQVWDIETGELLRVLKGHVSWVSAVTRLDDYRVISASLDNTLRVWDVERGKSPQGPTNDEFRAVVRISKDLTVFAIDDLLCVAAAGHGIQRYLRSHAGATNALARLDDHRVVSASDDGTLRVWDVKTGKCLRRLKGHTLEVDVVARVDHHRVISSSWDETIRIWDVETGKTLRKLNGRVEALACLDGDKAIVATENEDLCIWDIATGKTLSILASNVGEIAVITLFDEHCLVTASADGALRTWEIATGRKLAEFTLETPAVSIEKVASGTINVWDKSGKSHWFFFERR